jgi:hypothetical protein
MWMTKRRKWIFIVPAALAGMTLFAFLGGAIVRLLWNGLLPPLFGFREVTFWQALGLLALSRILFGGFGLRASPGPRARRRIEERLEERMAERWERMTPEERERFRYGMHGRWGSADQRGDRPAGPRDPE